MIRIEQTNRDNFREDSLDGFDRLLTAENEYRLVGGELKLVRAPSSESWTPERRREKAREILSGRFLTYCAFDGGRVVGEIMLVPALDHGRLIIDSFQVSREYRRRGVGRALLKKAKETARERKARALYVSALPAEATIGFYLAMGFRPSGDPIACYAEDKPFDIQMEYRLREERTMNEFIAYCGLDCESCEARLATVNDDEALREKVAALWSKLNGIEITPESIHCVGCRRSGVKTPFCESLCPIRQCALGRGVETCGACAGMESCETLGMITGSNSDALERLRES